METLWPRWGHVGNGGCHETNISIFIYLCIYRARWQIERRGKCSFKGEGIVTPMFPPFCKYNYIGQETMENSICVTIWFDEPLYKRSMNVTFVIKIKWISVAQLLKGGVPREIVDAMKEMVRGTKNGWDNPHQTSTLLDLISQDQNSPLTHGWITIRLVGGKASSRVNEGMG